MHLRIVVPEEGGESLIAIVIVFIESRVGGIEMIGVVLGGGIGLGLAVLGADGETIIADIEWEALAEAPSVAGLGDLGPIQCAVGGAVAGNGGGDSVHILTVLIYRKKALGHARLLLTRKFTCRNAPTSKGRSATFYHGGIQKQ